MRPGSRWDEALGRQAATLQGTIDALILAYRGGGDVVTACEIMAEEHEVYTALLEAAPHDVFTRHAAMHLGTGS